MPTLKKRRRKKDLNSLTLDLEELGKKIFLNFKANGRNEIIKIKAEINKTDNRITVVRTDKTTSCFFEKNQQD